jgi:hypothetical protein
MLRQSSTNTCPLSERLASNLHRGVTPRGYETSGHLVSAKPSLSTRTRALTVIGPPTTLFRLSLHYHVKAILRFAWIRISSEAPCASWGFVMEILMDLRPASPTVALQGEVQPQ